MTYVHSSKLPVYHPVKCFPAISVWPWGHTPYPLNTPLYSSVYTHQTVVVEHDSGVLKSKSLYCTCTSHN